MLDVVRLYHLPAIVAWICDIIFAIFYVAYIEKQVFLAQVRQVQFFAKILNRNQLLRVKDVNKANVVFLILSNRKSDVV